MSAVANLGGVTPSEAVHAVKETITLLETYNEIVQGGWDTARAMLERTYGSARGLEMMRHLTVTSHRFVRPFQRLNQVEGRQLLQLMVNEHPQIIALVIGQIEPAVAAAVIQMMPTDLAAEVTRRLTKAIKVPPQILMIIEDVLSGELKVTDSSEVTGGLDALVPILNRLETSAEKSIIEKIAEKDKALADLIAGQLFTFEDMRTIDDAGIQIILRQIPPETMAMALRNASTELKDKIMNNMSEKAREIMQDNLQNMSRVRLREVEQAQREIITLIHSLEGEGSLIIPRDGGDEYIE